jgi:predicted transcriptional regulator
MMPMEQVAELTTFTPRHKPAPLSRLIELRKKGLSLSEIGKLNGCSKVAVSQRFSRAGINPDDLIDYVDSKAVMHESLQYRIHKAVNEADIKKAPLGTKVLAICQLEDKIRLLRDQSTANIQVKGVVAEVQDSLRANQQRIEALQRELEAQDVVLDPSNNVQDDATS